MGKRLLVAAFVAAQFVVTANAVAQDQKTKEPVCADAIDLRDIAIGYGNETVEVVGEAGKAVGTAAVVSAEAVAGAAKATAHYVAIEYKEAKGRRDYADPVVAVLAVAGDGTVHLVAKVSKDVALGVAKGVTASADAVRDAAVATATWVSKPYVEAFNEFGNEDLASIFAATMKGTGVLFARVGKGMYKGVVITGKAIGKAAAFPVKMVMRFLRNGKENACQNAIKRLKKQLEQGKTPLTLG